MALLYMGHTAEANPRDNPRIPLIVRMYQKFLTKVARMGKTIAIPAMIINDYEINTRNRGYSTHTKLVTEPHTKRRTNGGKNEDSGCEQTLDVRKAKKNHNVEIQRNVVRRIEQCALDKRLG